MAVEHGARLLGLMLQVEAHEDSVGIDRDVRAAIRKAKSTGQPE
jgi:hypothetical protein